MGGFTPTTRKLLEAPLDPKHVSQRTQSGRSLDYIEGWHAIAEANRLFGFDSWDRITLSLDCVQAHERKVGRQGKDGWGVTYIARVRIVVRAGSVETTREGTGAGHGIDVDLGQAHESASKEAETDAMKRALMMFGNQFGLALYDKSKANVGTVEPTKPKGAAREDFTRFTDALRDIHDVESLKLWWDGTRDSEPYKELPNDWKRNLVAEVEEHRDRLNERSAA